MGDFIIHMDNFKNTLDKDFTPCIDSLGFQQFVNFPTQNKESAAQV